MEYINTQVSNVMMAHPYKSQYLGDWVGRSRAQHQPAVIDKILRLKQKNNQREKTEGRGRE